MSDNNYDVLVPSSAAKWLGLGFGLLVPLFVAIIAGQSYINDGPADAQVYPLPEE